MNARAAGAPAPYGTRWPERRWPRGGRERRCVLAARDQPAIDRERDGAGDHQADERLARTARWRAWRRSRRTSAGRGWSTRSVVAIDAVWDAKASGVAWRTVVPTAGATGWTATAPPVRISCRPAAG